MFDPAPRSSGIRGFLRGTFGRLAADDAPRERRTHADDADVIEGTAALDGFSGPSHWLGWAGFGMDHLEPIDWDGAAPAEGAKAADAARAARPEDRGRG